MVSKTTIYGHAKIGFPKLGRIGGWEAKCI